MKIEAKKSWGDYYEIIVSTNGARIEEDMLTQGQVDALVSGLVEDTILCGCYTNETVKRFIDVGLLTVEMLEEYLADINEEYDDGL